MHTQQISPNLFISATRAVSRLIHWTAQENGGTESTRKYLAEKVNTILQYNYQGTIYSRQDGVQVFKMLLKMYLKPTLENVENYFYIFFLIGKAIKIGTPILENMIFATPSDYVTFRACRRYTWKDMLLCSSKQTVGKTALPAVPTLLLEPTLMLEDV